MAESWDIKTFVDIQSALSHEKTVKVVFGENVGIGSVTTHTITEVRTTKNKTELEVKFGKSQSFIPINEFDLITINA